MNHAELIKTALNQSQMVMDMLLADLSDADLLARPSPGANHLAWQLGHLIAAEQRILEGLGADMPALPDGFEARHGRETATVDDAGAFDDKATYLQRYGQVRAATQAFVDRLAPARLDEPGPEMIRQIAPRVADALLLVAGHQMMHMGQCTAIRRRLGKPIAF